MKLSLKIEFNFQYLFQPWLADLLVQFYKVCPETKHGNEKKKKDSLASIIKHFQLFLLSVQALDQKQMRLSAAVVERFIMLQVAIL